MATGKKVTPTRKLRFPISTVSSNPGPTYVDQGNSPAVSVSIRARGRSRRRIEYRERDFARVGASTVSSASLRVSSETEELRDRHICAGIMTTFHFGYIDFCEHAGPNWIPAGENNNSSDVPEKAGKPKPGSSPSFQKAGKMVWHDGLRDMEMGQVGSFSP